MPADIEQLLQGLNLGKYVEAFAENEIEASDLEHLTDEDLKELGLPIGPRRRFLAAVRTSALDAFSHESTAASTEAPSAPPKTVSSADRRQLSVLFCDLCRRRSNTGPLRRPDHPAAGGAKFRHWVVFHRVDGRRGDVLSGPLPEDPACVSA